MPVFPIPRINFIKYVAFKEEKNIRSARNRVFLDLQ